MSRDSMYIHCKKDFRGMIDIREHTVKEALNEDKNITVTCGSFPGRSVYSPEELKNPASISKEFQDQFVKGRTYRLYSYPWKFE